MTTHTTKTALLRLLSVLLLVFAAFAGQARALEVPPYEGPVNDRAGMMPENVTRTLEEYLRDAEQENGVRIAGLTIPTLAGEDPAKFAERTAAAWGLDKGDGRWALLLVAEREEAIRIATGRGVADKLTAELGVRIVAEEMRPYFKAGEAGRGVAGGLLALPLAAVLGEFEPSDGAREHASAQAAKPAGRAAAKPAAKPAGDPDDGQDGGLEVPRLDGPVNDLAGVLSPETRKRLTDELHALNRKSGIQIAVLTIPTLAGEILEEFSMKTATAWGLGKKGEDNGVLFLVAMKERKIRIEVGYGLEDKLTDLLCGRIIKEEIAPAFRAGHPDEGVANGVAALMRAAQSGEFAPSAAALAFAKSVKDKQRNMFILGLGLVFVNVLLGVGAYLRKRPAMRQAAFKEDLEQVKDKHLGIMCLLSAVVAIAATLLLGHETRETVFGIVLCVVCGALWGPILYFFTLQVLAPDGKNLPWRNPPALSASGSSSSSDDEDDSWR